MEIIRVLLILFIHSVSSRLEFLYSKDKPGGTMVGNPKEKNGIKGVTEDRFLTSAYGLAVADGVSLTSLPSGHLANLLVRSSMQYFTRYQIRDTTYQKEANDIASGTTPKTFAMGLSKHIEENIDKFDEHLKVKLKEMLKLAVEEIPDSSSTLISLYLNNKNEEEAEAYVFQYGDSVGYRFRLQKTQEGYNYFSPVQILPETQEFFNCPYQFQSPRNRKSIEINDDTVRSMDVKQNDIFLLGSDGFFDNLFLSVITYCLNYLILAQQDYHFGLIDKPDPKTILNPVFRAFMDFLAKHNPTVNFYKKINDAFLKTQTSQFNLEENDSYSRSKIENDWKTVFKKFFEDVMSREADTLPLSDNLLDFDDLDNLLSDPKLETDNNNIKIPLTLDESKKRWEEDIKKNRPSGKLGMGKRENASSFISFLDSERSNFSSTKDTQRSNLKTPSKLGQNRGSTISNNKSNIPNSTSTTTFNRNNNLAQKPPLSGSKIQRSKIPQPQANGSKTSFINSKVQTNTRNTNRRSNLEQKGPKIVVEDLAAEIKPLVDLGLMFEKCTLDDLLVEHHDKRFSNCVKKAMKDTFKFSEHAFNFYEEFVDPQFISDALAHFAHNFYKDPSNKIYPFSIELYRNNVDIRDQFNSFTGKQDDITVIAGFVVDTERKKYERMEMRKKFISDDFKVNMRKNLERLFSITI